jgi:MoxR-like ATPase
MKINMGLLSSDEERQMLDRFIDAEPLKEIGAVCNAEDIKVLQKACREVFVHDDLRDYIVAIVQATRKNRAGVSPRGTLALLRASQGYALAEGREYVVPEDIKIVAPYVLCHRLIGDMDEAEKNGAVIGILNSTPLPTEDWTKR